MLPHLKPMNRKSDKIKRGVCVRVCGGEEGVMHVNKEFAIEPELQAVI